MNEEPILPVCYHQCPHRLIMHRNKSFLRRRRTPLKQSLEAILQQFCTPPADDVAPWVALIDHLRPRRASNAVQAGQSLQRLIDLLAARDDLRQCMSAALARLFRERKQVSLYVASGLLPSTGFFSETARRISGRLLPEVVDTTYMKDVLSVVFHRVDDEVWVNAIDDAQWEALFSLLFPVEETDHGRPPQVLDEIIEALRVLSYHVSSIGLEPELVRIDPTLEQHESPFLAQNAEVLAYLAHYRAWWADPGTALEDERHLTVMLDQCAEVLQRIRRRASKIGTSLTLTFKLERLRQHLDRIACLLDLLARLRTDRNAVSVASQAVALFKTLVHAECRKNNLSDYWGQNVELLSLRMTESASRTGERYITATRGEYFGILRSAIIGGFIIALMAALKIILGRQGFAPLNEALTFCLNYGIGFALIHVLGGTVATKQPAMTANAIAASIGEARGKSRSLDALADLIVRTARSQFAAILGNVGIAVPLAMLIALAIHSLGGAHFVSTDEAHKLLAEVDPRGGALFFAAVAGVCLFLSGLIAGYYDNLSAYNRIPQRLRQLRWPRRLLGEARMGRVASYVENNLGALAGNFFFGFLLGGATALGVLFGLPLDIRHIAFSSAYVGYASAALDFMMSWQMVAVTAAGVAGIGLVNLAVSFSLTLYVAMRARRITFDHARSLGRLVLQRLLTRPHEFILPPRGERSSEPPPPPATELAVPSRLPPAGDTLGEPPTNR